MGVLLGADQTAEVSALSCAAQVTKEKKIYFGDTEHCNVTSDGRAPSKLEQASLRRPAAAEGGHLLRRSRDLHGAALVGGPRGAATRLRHRAGPLHRGLGRGATSGKLPQRGLWPWWRGQRPLRPAGGRGPGGASQPQQARWRGSLRVRCLGAALGASASHLRRPSSLGDDESHRMHRRSSWRTWGWQVVRGVAHACLWGRFHKDLVQELFTLNVVTSCSRAAT